MAHTWSSPGRPVWSERPSPRCGCGWWFVGFVGLPGVVWDPEENQDKIWIWGLGGSGDPFLKITKNTVNAISSVHIFLSIFIR